MRPTFPDDANGPAFQYEGQDTNAFQAWYFRRMQGLYASMPPDVARMAEQCDRYVYSLRGWWLWAGVLLALALVFLLLLTLGVPAVASGALSFLLIGGLAWHGLLIWLAPTPDLRLQLKAWQRQRSASAVSHRGSQLLGGILVGAASGYVSITLFLKLSGGFAGHHDDVDWRGLLMLILALMLLWFVAQGILSRIRRRQVERWMLEQERRRALDSARADAAEHHLRLLQSQIQPHFLFNTLSTLRFRVERNPEEAARMVDELSRYLRAAIKPQGQVRSTLREELEVVRPYLRLMESRLGQRLSWTVSVPEPLLTLSLPTGSLLALVEDALTTSIEPSLKGGLLRIQGHELVDGRPPRLQVLCEVPGMAFEGDPLRLQTVQRLQDMAGSSVTFAMAAGMTGLAGDEADASPELGVNIEWPAA